MSWVTPKTWWSAVNDKINYTDVNRIKNNVQALYDSLLVFQTNQYEYRTTPEQPYGKMIVLPAYDNYYFLLDLTWTGADTRTYSNKYYIHGVGEHHFGEDCPFIREENCVATGSMTVTVGGYQFDIEPMFTDKAVNDLWYADEFNMVIDNLDTICRNTFNTGFSGKPYYAENGHTPTAEELNIIERFTQNLYNRIVSTFDVHVGEGYAGNRITNMIL